MCEERAFFGRRSSLSVGRVGGNKHGDFLMTSTIKFALLAALGTALLAGPVAAKTYQQPQAKHLNVNSAAAYGKHARASDGRVYLLENNGARNTNAAESFQDQFNIDY
jgi:hypothetical protein